jgi:DNA-binding CsgD family transcriptional regulator
LVGRKSELGRLRGALDRLAEGHGGLVLVTGEPGIGKTRLVEELDTEATERGAFVAWGRVDEGHGAPPYWPWIQILAAIRSGGDRDLIDGALDGVAEVIAPLLPQAGTFAADIPAAATLDPVHARFRLHQAVVEFLWRFGRQQSLVIVIDDAHWADVASLELTRFVAGRLVSLPVLFVVSYRSIDAGDSAAFHDVLASLARERTLQRITLTGLSQHEAARMIVQSTDVEVEAAVVSAAHARSEGNPFFLGELARLLSSEGLLEDPQGGRTLEGGVPSGVRDVVRRRLARLPGATRDLLVVAAVIGRDFEVSLLAGVSDVGELDTLDRLGPAIAAGLVGQVTGSVETLRFSHALVRDAVYGELAALSAATLHARVGDALERHAGPRPPLAELAGHFFHGAPVLGPERGLVYALAAAEAARTGLAYERAEDDLLRALRLVELLEPGTDRLESELQVHNQLVGLMSLTRGYASPEVERSCARARWLCEQIGATDGLFKALNNLAGFHHVRGDFGVVAQLAGQLLTIGKQRSNAMWLTAGHLFLAISQLHTGELEAARDNFRSVRKLASTLPLSSQTAESFLGPHPMPMGLVYSSRAAWATGDVIEAVDLAGEGVRLATVLGHPHTLAFAWYFASHLQILLGNVPAVLAASERAITYCDEQGLTTYRCWFGLFRGWAICQQGRAAEGVAEMAAAVAVNQAAGAQVNRSVFLGLLAEGEMCRGNGTRALALVDEALALRGEDRLFESDLYRRRGELLGAQGPDHRADAVDALRTAVAIAAAQGAVSFKRRAEAALATFEAADDVKTPILAAGERFSLSPRERELLRLVGQGSTDKEIAGQLYISVATVRSHLDRIRDKTARRRRAELTRLAVELGLMSD